MSGLAAAQSQAGTEQIHQDREFAGFKKQKKIKKHKFKKIWII